MTYFFTPYTSEQEHAHQLSRVILRILGTERYQEFHAKIFPNGAMSGRNWSEIERIYAAALMEYSEYPDAELLGINNNGYPMFVHKIKDADTCACVTDAQSCPACRATANQVYSEMPY